MRWTALLFLVLGASALVFAASHLPLSGTYRIGGATFYDPPADEPQDTHIYFQLTGAPARDLYNIMKVKPVSDPCTPQAQTKVIDGMRCERSNRDEYRCWFGVDVERQRIVNGVVC